ncbi:Relaxase/Mobilisation nuclease domain-containing protein [Marinobacter segnicrescens]|uniref:Relaxase/Mobilisation nuclease domain-containing protein n=1 Tax=Marinobacter segnicrescens TaxID=430453 RepID=A0A1I0H8L3_9GAMM|nr:relaxase/mobilization nuclease domain-containing protein [Marinobacter segnicrescens]SET80054.1 Relaxase/Mobilisation nuclease domain-containing protein [Marinobacter segnicrescens]
MIHKKMAYRNSSGNTLRYVFRGDGHEHDVKDCVHLIHTQGLSPNPIRRDEKGRVVEIDTDPMEQEFDYLADKNQRSENRFAHYVISLPHGEKLSHEQWKKAAKKYMRAMGYGLDTKWTAALHDEKDHQHIHIVACRVQNNPQAMERSEARKNGGKGNKPQPYRLVDDANDHARGMEVMRELENEFGLSVTPSPDTTWGADLSRQEFEGTIRNFGKTGESQAPWKTRIIARLSKAVEKSQGKTFSEFLDNVRAVGVEPLVTLNDKGFPTGISYSMEGRSAAGAKLKSTRLTFSALTGMKYDRETNLMKPTGKKSEGIKYEQERDISACIKTTPGARSDGSRPEAGGPRSTVEKAEGRRIDKESSTTKINSKTQGAPLSKSAVMSMNSKSGIDELLTLSNVLTDLAIHKSHSRKMARLQWGEHYDI